MMGSKLFGHGRPCDLSLYAQGTDDVLQNEMEELRHQNLRAAGVYRRLYESGAPGVLLADEVGKGKTYVALGVAFGLLAKKNNARVVILTHSNHMAAEWASRWSKKMKANCPDYEAKFATNGEWQPHIFRSFESLRAAYSNSVPPQIAIGSYETLKKYSSAHDEASCLHALLTWVFNCYAVRLSKARRRELVHEVLKGVDFRRPLLQLRISRAAAHRFLRESFDPGEKAWKIPASHIRDLVDEFVADFHRQKLDDQIDLLIIDEAHKLEGATRQRVITRLLSKRFRKCIFVTATPFALSVDQFRRRLLEFRHASTSTQSFVDKITALPLREFARSVQAGEDFPGKLSLEENLRQYMVRGTWKSNERKNNNWKATSQQDSLVPTIILERIIDGVLAEKSQTHIASRRESLCSSWIAAANSLQQTPIKLAGHWPDLFQRSISGPGGSKRADPKMQKAIRELTELIKRGEKTVIFTQRIATARLLRG